MADSINIKKLAFDPEDGLANTTSFPDPANEAETREQLMRLHLQTQDYLNTDLYKVLQTLAAATGDEQAIQTILTQIENLQKEVDTLSNMGYSHPVAYGKPAIFTAVGTKNIRGFDGSATIIDGNYVGFDSDSNAFVVQKEGIYKISFSTYWSTNSTTEFRASSGISVIDSSGNERNYIGYAQGTNYVTTTYIDAIHLHVGERLKAYTYGSYIGITGECQNCIIEILEETS